MEKGTSSPENNQNQESQQSPEKRKIVIIEASGAVEEKARDAADSQLTESLEKQRGVRGFVNRIWKHNLFLEYYRQKEIQKAKNKIAETGNIYAPEGEEKSAHEAAMKAIVDRFSSEYDETLHREAGETKEYLDDSEKEEGIKSQIKNLISEFSGKDLSEKNITDFHERKNAIFSKIKGVKKEVIDKEVFYADNLLEIIKGIQENVKNGEGLNNLDLDFDVVVGKAKTGVRTEAQFNVVDRIIDRIQKTRIGKLANEATFSTAVSIAYSLTAGTFQKLASSRLFAWGTFGTTAVFGAGIAGFREKKRLEEERRQHGREMAMNKKFNPERSPRREKMQEFVYEMKEANVLADDLEKSLYKEGTREIRDLDQEGLETALNNLAEIESRIEISDRQKVDLISFSESTKVEQERLRLDILRAQAKVDLKKLIGDKTEKKTSGEEFNYKLEGLVNSEEIKSFFDSEGYRNEKNETERKRLLAHWLSSERLKKGFKLEDIEESHGSFRDESAREYANWDYIRAEEILNAWKTASEKENEKYLSLLIDIKSRNLIEGDIEGEKGMKYRDRLFRKMRKKQVAKAVIRGLVTGLVIGGTVQEAVAFFKGGQDGFVEGLIRGHRDVAGETVHFTPLEYLRRYFTGDLPKADMSNLYETIVGNSHIKLPEGVNIAQNPDGSFNLMRGGEVISEGITLDSQGSLTEEAKSMLAAKGITGTSTIEHIAGTKTGEISIQDYIERHRDSLTEIRRTLWYDNDTSGIFDKNELRLDWGGVKGTGIDENGNYVYSVRRMLSDGSFHKEFSADALKLAREGELKLLLTLSQDSQSVVFEVPIDENYNAIIDPKSEMGRLLFNNTNGRAELLAQFAEVAEVTGTKDGVEQVRILATDVGKGIESIVGEVPDAKDVPTTTIQLPVDYRVDPPPFIPIISRRPLEPAGGLKSAPENVNVQEVNDGLLSIEERIKLSGWNASYELAKIAKQKRIDLSTLSREDYANFAIENSLAIDDNQLRMSSWQRMCESVEEIDAISEEKRKLINGESNKAFEKFSSEMKEKAKNIKEEDRLIQDGIRVKRGTEDHDDWLFFQINEGIVAGSKEIHKSYISVKDLNKLTPERFISFMARLKDAGYNGDIKIFQDLRMQGVGLNDQIVMHGASEKDAMLALNVAENFFSDELDQKSVGKDEIVDGESLSYSQTLSKKIKNSIQLPQKINEK